jgi:cytochrome c oxidase subunit I+III
MPGQPWGVRSIPEIDSRYPLWEQTNFTRNVDEGRFYMPDAEEGKREMLITSVIDARPIQVLRILGPSPLPVVAAVFTGGIFIFPTFKLWTAMAVSTVIALGVILYWFWVGSALIPEKQEKEIGLGVRVPLYASGPASVGWWAMFITMLADITAFASILFGYFFYWSLKSEFPPSGVPTPHPLLPMAAAGLLGASWLLTIGARSWNKADRAVAFYSALAVGVVFALAGAATLIWGLWTAGLDPKVHVYAATLWLIAIWTALHAVIGAIMQMYCLARRWAKRMTAQYDIDICNTVLYWHFVALTTAAAVTVLAVFPSMR